MQYQYFTVTEDHLKLLRRFHVGWQNMETGAPEIDPKKPYGNGGVEGDIHKILTGGNGKLFDEDCQRYRAIHRETEKALQIVLSTGYFKPGKYKCEMGGYEWTEV